MSRLIFGVFKWMAWKCATLILILAVLLGGAWIGGELKKTDELRQERGDAEARKVVLLRETEDLKRESEAQLRKSQVLVQRSRSILDIKVWQRQLLWEAHPVARKNPFSGASGKIRVLDLEIATYQLAVEEELRAKDALSAGRRTLGETRGRELAEIDRRIAGLNEEIDSAFVTRLANVVLQKLPIALVVLAGIIFGPMGIKAFMYFIVAPWASGRPPIRLLPTKSGSIVSPSLVEISQGERGRMSAVSRAIVLGENQELLIKSECLQRISLRARKSHKWLLNSSIPFSSVASGMFMLTRVTSIGSDPVVISPTKDPLSEIGILELKENSAFVCQPRSLAGVIQDRRYPMRITRHWRLGSLQGWLTLQLRFVVFHGPGQLVLKGCRGIRIESGGAGQVINQAATLGFSANLEYSNTRCETFVPYWTGEMDLFNDLFAGENGVYVYEEMPDFKGASGISGRGLEGFLDSALKVFGL